MKKKIEIKTLLKVGFSQRYIAETLSVSKTCVWNVAKKLKQNLPLSNSRGQGRKKASITTDDRNLLRLCKQDRKKTSHELSSEHVLSNGKQLSAQIIRCRRFLDMRYKSYTAKSKLFRKSEHKKERLSFAKEHQNWLNEWNNINWSDEAHFEVFNRKNRTFVRRLKSNLVNYFISFQECKEVNDMLVYGAGCQEMLVVHWSYILVKLMSLLILR